MVGTTNPSGRRFPSWGALSLAVAIGVMASAGISAFILDTFIARPIIGGGSITTLLPGVAYSTALIMKVCLVQSLVLAVTGVAGGIQRRISQPKPASKTMLERDGAAPIWSILSVTIPPIAPLLGAIAVLIAEALVDKPDGVSSSYFPRISRLGVLVMLGLIAFAAAAAVIGLLRRETPRGISILGIITNVCLIAVFRYWEFYKLGFDQDKWNDI